MTQEHPFAPYVRILGKGQKGSRSLTQQEAFTAMQMILNAEVEPEQLGAFLMLLRVKEESPEELAGFIEAARVGMQRPEGLQVDLDWSSYAGKKRQLPWFLLSILTLAGSGVRIFMHGARGHTPDRIYSEDMLALFGIAACQSWQQVEHDLAARNVAFMSIDTLCPELGRIINLRPILGLRSPVHTLCRLLNPLHARHTVDGVFHPAYGPMHQKTALLLGVEHGLTIKGDGGEAEIKPDSECDLQWTHEGQYTTSLWPRYYPRRLVREELDTADLLALWRGEKRHEYGEGALVSTLAVVLRLLGREGDEAALLSQAEDLWHGRNKAAY